MLRSLSVKIGMLAATIAAVLWIGWPAPNDERRQEPAGQQVAVQTPQAAPVPSVAPAPPASKVDLNRASVDELALLPGVGPVLAQRMVAWRKAHGRYRSVEDLQGVKGIGKKRLEQLRPLVIVKS